VTYKKPERSSEQSGRDLHRREPAVNLPSVMGVLLIGCGGGLTFDLQRS